MSEETIFTIIIVAAYIYGFWRGWKQLTKGEGFLASRLPQNAKMWLNQKKPGSVAAKIGISCVLAYLFAAVALAVLAYTVIRIIGHIVNGLFK